MGDETERIVGDFSTPADKERLIAALRRLETVQAHWERADSYERMTRDPLLVEAYLDGKVDL